VGNISAQLTEIVNQAGLIFNELSTEDWNYRTGPGKWSKKEILGHLIDSAANNHQRFVRAQYEESALIKYDQNLWVEVQDYKDEPVEELIGLWKNFNHHLAYIISKIPAVKLENFCSIGKDEPVTLGWVIEDYIRHLKHHLNQIIGRLEFKETA
jgi:hypothetical protein